MNIFAGARLASYEIISRIGAGGMGEVWRGRDARIGRDIAIKVLPASFAADADRLQRFEQEARAAGTLNHPNLVTIYELGRHDGAPFMAMELLHGETLRERLGNDPSHAAGEGSAVRGSAIPPRKAVDYAIQIANGLAVAHEQGIIHRDLKPENLFVTTDGRVKILDFGLAKLHPDAASRDEESKTQRRGTAPGAVMGTAGYMSPEQVRGQPIDQRSDIFAFGAVLYEMASGRRAFQGESSVETMNAILHNDPPELITSGEHVSPAIDRIIRRCLEKERAERFDSARDIAFALEAVSGASFSSPAAAVAVESIWSRATRGWIAAALGLIVLGAVAAVAYRAGRATIRRAEVAFSQLTFNAGVESEPALSADGKTFAFVRIVDGQKDVFVQRVDGQSAINVTKGSVAGDSQPSFSPDGRLIAFRSERDGGGIFVIGASGESVRRVTDTGFNPAWSPDGKEIVYASEAVINPRSRYSISSLSIVTVANGTTRLLFKGDAIQPRWSPNGRRIAFWSIDQSGNREIQTISATPGKNDAVTTITHDPALDWNPVWSPDGGAIFFLSDRDGTMNLWRVAVDQQSGTATGAAEPLRVPATDVAFLSSSSSDGRFLYQSASSRGQLRYLSFDPETSAIRVAPEPVFAGSMLVRTASVSPDGVWIAFTTEARQEDVFVMRSDGTDVRQLTNDAARDRGVSWWPDGSRIVFYSNRVDTYEVWSIRPDGSGLTRLTNLSRGPALGANFPRVSRDGKRLAYFSLVTGGNVATPGGAKFQHSEEVLPPLPGGMGLFWPQSWSPDGRRIIGSAWSDRPGLYVYSFDTKQYALVEPKGLLGGWVDDSRILFLDQTSRLGVADLRAGKSRFAGLIDGLSLGAGWKGSQAIDVSPTGRHIVFSRSDHQADLWLMTIGDASRDASN